MGVKFDIVKIYTKARISLFTLDIIFVITALSVGDKKL